jgi:hypothetical protein
MANPDSIDWPDWLHMEHMDEDAEEDTNYGAPDDCSNTPPYNGSGDENGGHLPASTSSQSLQEFAFPMTDFIPICTGNVDNEDDDEESYRCHLHADTSPTESWQEETLSPLPQRNLPPSPPVQQGTTVTPPPQNRLLMPALSPIAQETALSFLFDLPPSEQAGIDVIRPSKNS